MVEETILRHPTVSRVLAEKFVFAQLWVGRDDDSTEFRKKIGAGEELPQYAIVDAEGRLLLMYDRPANVATMTPDGFAAFLEDGLKAASP